MGVTGCGCRGLARGGLIAANHAHVALNTRVKALDTRSCFLVMLILCTLLLRCPYQLLQDICRSYCVPFVSLTRVSTCGKGTGMLLLLCIICGWLLPRCHPQISVWFLGTLPTGMC